jgi:hypothetical protein
MTLPLVLVLLAQPADRLQVDWLVPEGCPDPMALTERVKAAIPKDRTFSASVRIDEPRAPQTSWRAVIITKARDGQSRTRAVDAPDCARVAEAAVLVLTLAATTMPPDDTGVSTPAVLPPATPSNPATSSSPTTAPGPAAPGEPLTPLPEDESVDRRRSRLRLNLRLQGLFGSTVGLLPGPGFSAGVGVAFAFGRLRLEAAVFPWLDAQTAESLRGARFGVTSIRARGCWMFEPAEAWFLGPCAGAEVAFLRVTGRGISQPVSADTHAVMALGGVTVGRQLSPLFRVGGSLELGVNALRPLFVIDTPVGAVEVHRMGLPVGRLTLGMEFYFP